MGEMGKGGFILLIFKELQRYGRNKNTVISKRYLKSGKYRKKFDQLSENRRANRLIYSLAKKMLYHRSGTKYEDMYWIDMDSLTVICAVTDCREESKIVYTDHVRKVLQKHKRVMTVHSHPNGCPPSLEDFNSSFIHNYELGIVCGHNGKVFVYSSREYISPEIYNHTYRQYFEYGKNEYEIQILTWNCLKDFYNISLKEV